MCQQTGTFFQKLNSLQGGNIIEYSMSFLNDEDRKRLYKELDYLQKELHHSWSTIWVVNSILITGSLLVAFEGKSEVFPTPLASILLILTSFLMNVTTEKMHSIWYTRLKEIRKCLGMQETARMYESKTSGNLWYLLRVYAIYFLYICLISIYFYLFSQRRFLSILIFLVSILVGVFVVAAREVRSYTRREIEKSKQKDS